MKNHKYILYLIIGFLCIFFSYILGYIISYILNFSVYFSAYKSNINITHFYIILVLTYYIAITIHELIHFIVFKINKINMRGLIIGPFIFIKMNNKWKFNFKITKIFFAGGIAIPDIDIIENIKDLNKFRNSFAKALIAAPVGNILFNILFILITIITKVSTQNEILNSYMLTILILLSIITLAITISCLIKNEFIIGDYQAYFEIKKDFNFALIQAYQYIMFSTKYITYDSRKYLMDKLNDYHELSTINHIVNSNIISSVDNILYDYLTGKIDILPKGTIDYINFSIANYKLIYDTLKQKEVPSIFLHHIVLYLALNKETKHNATEFYSYISTIIKINTPVIKYYDMRTNHLLGLQNNIDYLSNRVNIKTSSLYELLSLFEGYYEDEYYLYNKIYNI